METEQLPDGSEPSVREIGLDEALALAVSCQRSGRLKDAEALYRKILELAPKNADALQYSGILAHQQGRLEEATELLEKSLAIEPGRADCHANLAINLHARGKVDEAIAACERAIAIDPQHANAHSNLGALLKVRGRLKEAEEEYRSAILLAPDHAGAYINLGILLAAQHRTREAVACYCKVITLSPRHPQARRLLAIAHVTIGEVDKAKRIYEEWLAEDPDDPVARHMLAACSGEDVPRRASNEYVSSVFDGFAADFETRLAQLEYRAPALVECMLGASVQGASHGLDLLDAGCGTGLCGQLVAPYARRLVGIDLSAGMLALAAEKHVYDELVHAEITDYLRGSADRFDAIVSADTLVYFGPLDEVVSLAAHALRRRGVLVFTLEEWAGAEAADTFSIKPHGRYTHARHYVEHVLREAALVPRIEHRELRLEGGVPVAGLVVCGVRPDGEGASNV